ncbi:MAG: hypothetical protein ACLTBV_27800 [Enterocloster bolteae]
MSGHDSRKGEDGNVAVPGTLGLEGTGKDSFIPSDRTEAYYQSRPCKALVGLAAGHTGCLSGGAFRQSISWQSIPAGYKPVWQPASSVPGLYGCRSIGETMTDNDRQWGS